VPFYRTVSTLRAVALDDASLLLKSDHASVRVEGASAKPVAEAIIPTLAGWASIDDVCARAGNYAREDIVTLIDSLVEARLLIVRNELPQGAFEHGTALPVLADIGIDEEAASKRLAALRIGVVGDGAHAHSLAAMLRAAGAATVRPLGTDEPLTREAILEAAGTLDCLLVAIDGAFLSARHWANQAALATGCPAIFIDIATTEAVVGPTVLPGETGCYLCFRMRHLATRDAFAEAMAHERDLDAMRELVGDRPSFPGLAAMALGALVSETFRLLFGPLRPDLANAVLVIDTLEATCVRHEVLRQPDCPQCRGIDTAVRIGD
jgi:bacteriocin biosynthesis cyclodehydratase domain-containing protein